MSVPAGDRIDPGLARPKICFVVSSPMTAEAFLGNHIRALSEYYDVHLVANAEPDSIRHPDLQHATRIRARIERAIAPLRDARALIELALILRRGAYSAVHSVTPKAGLVCALAAFIARVPVRIHTFTGQVWATRSGATRWLLRSLDRLIAALDTHLMVDSLSQRDFLRTEGVLRPAQGLVLGSGSVCGVDPLRFRADPPARAAVRAELHIPAEALIFLFVGRFTRDKGVLDLAGAFAGVAAQRENAWLVLVGPDEEGMGTTIRSACGPYAARVRFTGHTPQPERFMAASDVFCLPSYREGFGSVILEAAAAGLPTIGSRIYGIVDAIEDGETGVLVEARDVASLSAAMERLATDRVLRETLALRARERALREFSSAALTRALVEFYATAVPPTSTRSGQAARARGGPPL